MYRDRRQVLRALNRATHHHRVSFRHSKVRACQHCEQTCPRPIPTQIGNGAQSIQVGSPVDQNAFATCQQIPSFHDSSTSCDHPSTPLQHASSASRTVRPSPLPTERARIRDEEKLNRCRHHASQSLFPIRALQVQSIQYANPVCPVPTWFPTMVRPLPMDATKQSRVDDAYAGLPHCHHVREQVRSSFLANNAKSRQKFLTE